MAKAASPPKKEVKKASETVAHPDSDESQVAPRPKRGTSNQALMIANARLAQSQTGLERETGESLAIPQSVALAMSAAQITILTQLTDTRYIRVREGRGGKQFKYVDGPYIIERLNLAFGWNWDIEIVDKGEVLVAGRVMEVWVEAKLTVRTPSGQTLNKTQFGSMAVEYLTAQGKTDIPVSIGDAYKGAETDAMKKAASLLGLGLDLYDTDGDISAERTTFHERENGKQAEQHAIQVVENEPKPLTEAQKRQVAEVAQQARGVEIRPTADWDDPDETKAQAAIEAAKLRAKADRHAEEGDPEMAEELSQEADKLAKPATPAEVAKDLDATFGRPFVEGVLTYKMVEDVKMVQVNPTTWKQADLIVNLSPKGLANMESLFKAVQHREAHLLKYHGVKTIPALTWERLVAVSMATKSNQFDPRWYGEKIDELAAKQAKAAQMVLKKKGPTDSVDALAKAYSIEWDDDLMDELLKLPDPMCLAYLYQGEKPWGKAQRDDLSALVMLVSTDQLELGSVQLAGAVATVKVG